MAPVDNIIVVQAANVALSNVEANITPANAPNGISIPGAGPGRTGFIAQAILHVPLVAGLTAGTVVTTNFRSGSTAAAPLIASGTDGTGTAQTSCGIDFSLPIPAGVQNLFVGVVLSGGTGTATNSATAPAALTLILLD